MILEKYTERGMISQHTKLLQELLGQRLWTMRGVLMRIETIGRTGQSDERASLEQRHLMLQYCVADLEKFLESLEKYGRQGEKIPDETIGEEILAQPHQARGIASPSQDHLGSKTKM